MSKLTSAPRAHLGEFPGPSKPWFSYLKRDKAGIRRLLLLELTEITKVSWPRWGPPRTAVCEDQAAPHSQATRASGLAFKNPDH